MKQVKNIEIIFPLFLVAFMIISSLSIKSSSYILTDAYSNFYIKQLSWYFIGFILFIYTLIIGNKYIYKYSSYIYFGSIILLLLLLFFGEEINGAKAWISLGEFSFQPSELTKIGLILYISKVLNDYHFSKNKNEFKLILKILIITLVPSVLVFLEPDTGAVISYFFIAFLMLFISGIKYKWFIIFIIIITFFIGIILYFYNFNNAKFIELIGPDIYYRIERIMFWKDGGIQLKNSLIAIGTGGLLGHGIAKTPLYFPEPYTDFIFGIYASNFGLIGSILLFFLIIMFDLRIIKFGIDSTKTMDKFVISGIVSTLVFFQIQNISMVIGLLPITGVPLPFISYGGSSLIIYMILLAIIINTKKKNI